VPQEGNEVMRSLIGGANQRTLETNWLI
jgi:hypothetical protein